MNYTEIIGQINDTTYEIKKNNMDSNSELKELMQTLSQQMLSDKGAAAEGIKKHFNEIVYNTSYGNHAVIRYRRESILKEIIQNIIDCEYIEGEDVEIKIGLNDLNKSILFQYNEYGFRIQDIIAFFSLGHSNKDENQTGAFGVGIKGAILSADKVKIKSSYYNTTYSNLACAVEFEISHIEKTGDRLNIDWLNIKENPECTHQTTLEIYIGDASTYEKIKKNLLDITGERIYEQITRQESYKEAAKKAKGKYLNPIELCFAALKKKDKKIELQVYEQGNIDTISVTYMLIYDSRTETVQFSQNNKGAILEVYRGKTDFIYLIPKSRVGDTETMPLYIEKYSYGYFSTYELTGSMNDKVLPKFYINIPTIDKEKIHDQDEKFYITEDRKAIQANKLDKVYNQISQDVYEFIRTIEDDSKLVINPQKDTLKWYNKVVTPQ